MNNSVMTNFDLTNDDLTIMKDLDNKLSDNKSPRGSHLFEKDGVLVEQNSYHQLSKITNGFTIDVGGCE